MEVNDGAPADPLPAVELVWNRAPGGEACIGPRELEERAEATLGHQVFVPLGEGKVFVKGQVGPDPSGRGWVAVVAVRGEDSPPARRELTLEAPDCRRLDEAIVLVVSLMLDAVLPGTSTLTIASGPRTTSISLGPDVAVATGMLPGVAVGMGFVGEIKFPSLFPIALWTHGWPFSWAPERVSGGRLSAWTFGLGICPLTFDFVKGQLFACAGGSGGEVYSNGVDLDVTRSDIRPFLQGELRAGAHYPISGSLFVRFELGGAIPLFRDSYEYTEADGKTHEIFRTAPAIPAAHIGLVVRSL